MADIKAIAGGMIVDGTGADPIPDGLVLIEKNRIAYAGPAGGRAIPAGAEVIDAAGATVIPGLMDVHVHISLSAPSDLTREIVARSIGEAAFEVARNLRDTVALGVTTIRTVSDLAHLDIAAGTAISEGKMIGPRVFACGKGMTTTGGHGDIMPCWLDQAHGDITETVDGPDPLRAAIRRQAKSGAHWIKLFLTGGVIDPHGRIDAEEFAPSEWETALETANMLGLPVAVHAHGKNAIMRCIRDGVRSVEHGMHFDQECADEALKVGTYLVPTLTVMNRILIDGATAGIPEFMIENVRKRTEQHHQYVKYIHDIGGNLACGTDAGSLLTPHGSARSEVVLFVKCGLTPLQAIQAATQGTARLLDIEDTVGTLQPGKLADVVVVNGDILGNIEELEVDSNIRSVLAGGRLVATGGKALPH